MSYIIVLLSGSLVLDWIDGSWIMDETLAVEGY